MALYQYWQLRIRMPHSRSLRDGDARSTHRQLIPQSLKDILMNKLALTAALIGSLVFTPAVFAAPVSKGEVTKVDTRRNRVTVKHGPLDNLEMPAMTMVFEVSDPAMMDRLAVGRAITFTADRVEGKLTIVEIE